nr:heparan-alpha-glucosaminide N-acetyltransferase domain-containing protein [Candidatus Sigynarchaeota archaeon]
MAQPPEVLHGSLHPPKPRILSVDVFRGGTIVAMVFVNFISNYYATPDWSRHAPDIGLTYVDLVAPFFIFAIALTYPMNFHRGQVKGGGVANFMQFIKRYCALIGLGFLLSMKDMTATGFTFQWDVLQQIGIAGLFTLIFIWIPRWPRLMVAAGLLVVYQVALGISLDVGGTPMLITTLNFNTPQGGVIGGLGWGLILLLGTIAGESLENGKSREFLILGAIYLAAGISIQVVAMQFPASSVEYLLLGISKRRISPAFILVSAGVASLIFYLAWYFYDKQKITKGRSIFLQPQGKNSLFLYIIQDSVRWPLLKIFSNTVDFWLVLVASSLLIAMMWLIAWLLDRKKIYLVL